MTREPSTTTTKRPQTPTKNTNEAKGQGKTNTKSGKNARYQPYQRQPRQWSFHYDKQQTYDKASDRSYSQQAESKAPWHKDSWSNDWTKPSK